MPYQTILEKYAPTKQDTLELKKTINAVLSKIKVKDASIIVGGSGGKNTWLKGTHDIDLYVKFNYSKYKDKSDQLSTLLYKALKKSFKKIDRLHGSRDYFQIGQDSFTFEIVPILDIKKHTQARNTTDLSQLHVTYVKKHPKVANEIRLAKVFAKAQNVYGAESYQRGFSGYCLEVLTIKYGSFKKLLRAIAKWKKTEHIGSKKLIAQLNAAKKESPLILIDPVQPDRNVAAALSQEKYDLLRKAAKQFMKNPSIRLFEEKKFDLRKLSKKGKLIFLEVSPLRGKKDIVGAKMLKAYEFIQKHIQLHDFELIDSNWQFSPETFSYMYFIVHPKPLSKEMQRLGPPLKAEKSVKIFKKKHKKTIKKGKRIYALLPRPFTTIEPCLEAILQEKNVKERVKEIKIQAIVEAKKL